MRVMRPFIVAQIILAFRDFPSIKAAWIGGTVSALSASVVAMIEMFVFYRLIAYLFLMRVGVPRKLGFPKFVV